MRQANLAKDSQRKLLAPIFSLIGGLLANNNSDQLKVYLEEIQQVQLPKDLREFLEAKFKELIDNIKNNNLL
jgi:hypothetical protein